MARAGLVVPCSWTPSREVAREEGQRGDRRGKEPTYTLSHFEDSQDRPALNDRSNRKRLGPAVSTTPCTSVVNHLRWT